MSRLRIVCKGEPIKSPEEIAAETDRRGFPLINGMCAAFADLELELVDSKGHAHAVHNVTRVEWIAEQGPEPARAVVHFIDVDVELEVDGKRITFVDERIAKVRAWVERQITEGNDHGAIEELAELVGGEPQ